MLGGYGITSHGRSEYGNAKSDIEPRFSASIPADEEHDVDVNTMVKFTLYAYSSFIDEEENVLIEISEDGGTIYNEAYRNGTFAALYSAGSRVRRSDGQRLDFYFVKAIPFASDSHIIFRVTARDEFGQEATKEVPVYW